MKLFNEELIKTLTGHKFLVFSVVFSPDEEYLVSGDRTIGVWKVSSGERIKTLTGYSLRVQCIVFSPNGEYLASGSHDKTIGV